MCVPHLSVNKDVYLHSAEVKKESGCSCEAH